MDFGIGYFPTHDALAERPFEFMVMSAPSDAAVLERLQQAGCRRAVHWVPSGGPGVIEAALQQWEAAIAQFRGEA